LEAEHGNFFRKVISPELGRLAEARAFAQEFGRRAGLSEERLFDLQVVVSEACANAMKHAASEVEIEAWLLSGRVIVEITSNGVLAPGLYTDDERRRQGLGPPLMVALSDQVHLARISGNRTQVSLTFFRDVGTGPNRPRSLNPRRRC
jgi:anti-sigma regulatory factor (Ser/Thr protein kinase)